MIKSKKIFRIALLTVIISFSAFLGYLVFDELHSKIIRFIQGRYKDYSILLPIIVGIFSIPSIFYHAQVYNFYRSYSLKRETSITSSFFWICNLGLGISLLAMGTFICSKEAYSFGIPVLCFAIIILIDNFKTKSFIEENNSTDLDKRMKDFGKKDE